MRSRNNDWLRAGRPRGRSSSPGRVRNFFDVVQTGSAVTQPIQLVPGVKRSVREADHTSSYCRSQENVDLYTSTTPYAFMAYCLIKHRNNFTLYLLLYCLYEKMECWIVRTSNCYSLVFICICLWLMTYLDFLSLGWSEDR
jgi:hypothetical protein